MRMSRFWCELFPLKNCIFTYFHQFTRISLLNRPIDNLDQRQNYSGYSQEALSMPTSSTLTLYENRSTTIPMGEDDDDVYDDDFLDRRDRSICSCIIL